MSSNKKVDIKASDNTIYDSSEIEHKMTCDSCHKLYSIGELNLYKDRYDVVLFALCKECDN